MVKLEICKPNDTSFDYIKVSKNFEQDKCWIHSYELNMNSGDKRPVEKFTLGFEKLWIWMRSRSKSGEYDGEHIRADVYFANFI